MRRFEYLVFNTTKLTYKKKKSEQVIIINDTIK